VQTEEFFGYHNDKQRHEYGATYQPAAEQLQNLTIGNRPPASFPFRRFSVS
jgi:hypothetical protein